MLEPAVCTGAGDQGRDIFGEVTVLPVIILGLHRTRELGEVTASAKGHQNSNLGLVALNPVLSQPLHLVLFCC